MLEPKTDMAVVKIYRSEEGDLRHADAQEHDSARGPRTLQDPRGGPQALRQGHPHPRLWPD